MKPSDALRFLGALCVAAVLLGLLVLRVTSCAPVPGARPGLSTPAVSEPPPPPAPAKIAASCAAPAWDTAARANAASLRSAVWTAHRRPEIGWETYGPLIAREIGTACGPDTPAFASAYAAWQAKQSLPATGQVTEEEFLRLKGVWNLRRPFVRISAQKICPEPPAGALEANRPGEGYGNKAIYLRPGAFAAYRRMVAAAKAEVPAIAADPRNLQIFSGYRSPTIDAQRCAQDGNCDNIVRATCSAHRTGLAVDLYVGQAPGFGPDSSADPNRLYMSQTPTYRWMVANADRFGFLPYPFEPWHWEWTGETP